MVASGVGLFRHVDREGRWQERAGTRRATAFASLVLVGLIVGWYGLLFARGDDDPRYAPGQCDVVRNDFLTGDTGGVIDEILRECAEEGR